MRLLARLRRSSHRLCAALPLLAFLALGALGACGDDAPSAPDPRTEGGAAIAPAVPEGWGFGGSGSVTAVVGFDSAVAHTPGRSVTIRRLAAGSGDRVFHTIVQSVRGAPYVGRRVRLAGAIRTAALDGGAALWMRVDGAGGTLAFDNMSGREPLGTTGWQEHAVVLDVPSGAAGIAIGALVHGTGQAWFDDLRFEVVGDDVALTSSPIELADVNPLLVDEQRRRYASAPLAFANLDFEGRPTATVHPDAVAWLTREAAPFERAAPGGSLADLEPLRAMVGSARVVGLGEGTHGTREFFQMKHRIVEFLVRELGFTAFAIEATWPEANAVDAWVRGGPGDPAVLLSNLYFWTWNTQEVLDLLHWMRAYNATVPAARQVRFFGVDMQHPGTAIDSVVAFVGRVDPARRGEVVAAYACLDAYRNRRHQAGDGTYAELNPQARAACTAAVGAAHALVAQRATPYADAGGAEAYARALRSARIVVQWEDMARQPVGTGEADRRRDVYMAENARWVLDQLPAGARVALWAHNAHVADTDGRMGAHLRDALGAAYLPIGLAFGTGAFHARTPGVDGAPFGPVTAHATSAVASGSFEAYLGATGLPRAIVDARRFGTAPETAALRQPLPLRLVGAIYEPSRELLVYAPTLLPGHFDVVVYLRTGSPPTLLPFRYE